MNKIQKKSSHLGLKINIENIVLIENKEDL